MNIQVDSTEVTIPIGVFSIIHSEDISEKDLGLKIVFPYTEVDEDELEFHQGHIRLGHQTIKTDILIPDWLLPGIEEMVHQYHRDQSSEIEYTDFNSTYLWM